MTDATDINLNAPTLDDQADLPESDDRLPADDQVQIAQAETEEVVEEETEGEETAEEAASGYGDQPAPEVESLAGQTLVNRPPAGQTVEVPVQPGERYVIDFDPTEAQVVIDGDDFILVFADGGRIVFPSLVPMAESANSPVLQVGGVDIGGDVILAQARALSGEQPTLETAAGETAAGPELQGSGENVYNDNLGDIIDTLVAQPDIPYVERQFGLIDVEVIDPLDLDEPISEPFIPSLSALPSLGTVGEAFLPPRSPSGSQYDPAAGPQISSDPSSPGVGFEGVAVFDQTNGGVITGLEPVGGTAATPRSAGESETVTYADGSTITLTTANDGDFLFFTPLGNLLLVNSVTGEYTYVLTDNEVQPGVGLSGSDDTIQEVFTFTVTDDFGQTVTSTITATIEDDAPAALDEAQLSVFENGTVAAPGSVLDNDTQGADGTDTVTSIGLTGAPADQQPIPAADGATIAGQFGTLTILQDGSYSYAANDLGDPPPANPVDTFVYTIVDEDGDSSQATISILVKESPVGGIAVAAGQTGDFIPEDVPTDVTLTASVGNPPDPNDVLTQIVVDFGTAIDLDGSNLADQWQLDPADLAAILALPEVTAVDLADGGSVLTITLNGTTQSFSSNLTLTTPDDSDVDLDGVLVTVTAVDTVFGSTGSGTTTNDINADAIVDGSEVFRNGAVINATNDSLGTTPGTNVNLGLSLALGPDSTDQGNGDVSQGDEDGSTAGDLTEEVTQVTVQVDQGATLTANTAPTSASTRAAALRSTPSTPPAWARPR